MSQNLSKYCLGSPAFVGTSEVGLDVHGWSLARPDGHLDLLETNGFSIIYDLHKVIHLLLVRWGAIL